MQVEVRRISDLTADPENARTHDKKNLDAIASSLEKFGQRKPIVVMPTGVILAGNGTWAAAKQLGWTEITVSVTPADWDYATAKAYALADNRTAELAEWDSGVLASQLLELDAEGWDITALGFDLPDTPQDLNEDEGPLTFDEEAEPITKLGDVYQLGRHRLMCGDSTSIDAVDALTEGKIMDMAFTDPPYGVAYTGGIQFADKDSGKAVTNNREMIQNDDIDLYNEVMGILALKVQGPCYVWFSYPPTTNIFQAAEKYGDVHALIIWVKNGGYGALNANYKQKHEPCLYWKPKGSTLRFTGATTETTIWEIDKDGKNKLHPTQKPIDLALKAIGNHDAKTVLDLFGGSGSTLIA